MDEELKKQVDNLSNSYYNNPTIGSGNNFSNNQTALENANNQKVMQGDMGGRPTQQAPSNLSTDYISPAQKLALGISYIPSLGGKLVEGTGNLISDAASSVSNLVTGSKDKQKYGIGSKTIDGGLITNANEQGSYVSFDGGKTSTWFPNKQYQFQQEQLAKLQSANQVQPNQVVNAQPQVNQEQQNVQKQIQQPFDANLIAGNINQRNNVSPYQTNYTQPNSNLYGNENFINNRNDFKQGTQNVVNYLSDIVKQQSDLHGKNSSKLDALMERYFSNQNTVGDLIDSAKSGSLSDMYAAAAKIKGLTNESKSILGNYLGYLKDNNNLLKQGMQNFQKSQANVMEGSNKELFDTTNSVLSKDNQNNFLQQKELYDMQEKNKLNKANQNEEEISKSKGFELFNILNSGKYNEEQKNQILSKFDPKVTNYYNDLNLKQEQFRNAKAIEQYNKQQDRQTQHAYDLERDKARADAAYKLKNPEAAQESALASKVMSDKNK